MRESPTLLETMTLLGLVGESWAPWRTVARVLSCEPLTSAERGLYERCTGRDTLPTEPPSEFWAVCGRRSGKSRFASVIGVHAALKAYPMLAPGERAVIAAAAADRAQAQVMFGYLTAPFGGEGRAPERAHPVREALRRLVGRSTRWEMDLTSGVTLSVHTSHFGRVRGRTFACALADETAFWADSETGANPAARVLDSIRPALITVRGMLFSGTTPMAKSGTAWETYERF